MNPAQLRKQAKKELERAQYHLRRAAFLDKTASELERLSASERSDTLFNEHMTPQALKNRNVAISGARSPGGLGKLVREKFDISLNVYAKKIGISPGSLSLYVNGKQPVPPRVFERIKRDVGFDTWPAGIKQE